MQLIWFSYALSYPRRIITAGNQLKLKSASKTEKVIINTKEKKNHVKFEREADYFELSSAV